jgi:hypothetical protein
VANLQRGEVRLVTTAIPIPRAVELHVLIGIETGVGHRLLLIAGFEDERADHGREDDGNRHH